MKSIYIVVGYEDVGLIMRQNEIAITVLILFLTMVTSFFLIIAEEVDFFYKIIIFIIISTIIIIVFIVMVYYFNEPEKDLEFTLIHEPEGRVEFKDIFKKGKTKLVWHFKNNLRKKVDLFNYIIFTTNDGKVVYSNHPKDDWSITINRGERTHEWKKTDPMGYGIGAEGVGVYEINCIINFKFQNGSNGIVFDMQEVKVI